MLLFMPILPIILAILYARMGIGEEMPLMVVYLVIGVTFSAVTTGCIMIMIAEENEKKTLRGLILSPASFTDIIIGKSLVTTLLTGFSLIISLFILGVGTFLHLREMVGLVLLYLFFLFLGIGIGLFVKSVGMTTVYLMPIMFAFGFSPMIEFLGFNEDSFIVTVANSLPILQLIKMDESTSWLPLGIVALWTLVAAIFTFICFRKARKDK